MAAWTPGTPRRCLGGSAGALWAGKGGKGPRCDLRPAGLGWQQPGSAVPWETWSTRPVVSLRHPGWELSGLEGPRARLPRASVFPVKQGLWLRPASWDAPGPGKRSSGAWPLSTQCRAGTCSLDPCPPNPGPPRASEGDLAWKLLRGGDEAVPVRMALRVLVRDLGTEQARDLPHRVSHSATGRDAGSWERQEGPPLEPASDRGPRHLDLGRQPCRSTGARLRVVYVLPLHMGRFVARPGGDGGLGGPPWALWARRPRPAPRPPREESVGGGRSPWTGLCLSPTHKGRPGPSARWPLWPSPGSS